MTQEQKAKAYDEAFEIAKNIHRFSSNIAEIKRMEELFPELVESEDEKIKNKLIHLIKMSSEVGGLALHKWEADEMLDWLEKQGESDKSLYIRFGNIPTNGKSKIYNGEIETGIEEGISVYSAFKDKEGNIILGLNLPITKTSLHTQQHLLEYDNRPCYLVTGDYVGKGTDGEPLIKNVRIIKEIKPYKIKQDKENNTYVINNTPNCGISLFYNEELKESEDEKIRKELITHCKNIRCVTEEGAESIAKWIAWLEKQGEQKPADKIEPKFKVGDWITNSIETVQITGYDIDYGYQVDCKGNLQHRDTDIIEKEYHLWTIQDAKNGDVLAEDSCIFIIQKLSNNNTSAKTYYTLYDDGDFDDGSTLYFDVDSTKPATKEQCDILFQKMKEAGYTFDFEKKELKKIKQKLQRMVSAEAKEALYDKPE